CYLKKHQVKSGLWLRAEFWHANCDTDGRVPGKQLHRATTKTRRRRTMNIGTLKKTVVSLSLAGMFLIGAAGSSSVLAQDWRWYDRDHDNRWEHREEQRGYFDGLTRGREDARDHRFFNPNNSSHF